MSHEAKGHRESANHVGAHSAKSCAHPVFPNGRPTISPLESRTQYVEWLCRRNPWQQHIQSWLIYLEKISLKKGTLIFLPPKGEGEGRKAEIWPSKNNEQIIQQHF